MVEHSAVNRVVVGSSPTRGVQRESKDSLILLFGKDFVARHFLKKEVFMGVLSELEPKRVFYYFEEISKIPHGSGNIEGISNYLVAFAQKHQLCYTQDEFKNVIIIKEASPGYEKEPVVILQGHMDMVAVKTPESSIDLQREGLRLAIEGDYVYARETSLGGDDGIAIAYALALLEAKDIKHPPLEVVITVDEEVGMDGARGIDLSKLIGKRMLNLDSEDEGIFLTSCAGGVRQKCTLSLEEKMRKGWAYEIIVGGLLGGHSGVDIHKERGNSNCLFARLLWNLKKELGISLYSLEGGLADNAIPRETKAIVVIAAEERDKFAEIVNTTEKQLVNELAGKDSSLGIQFKALAEDDYSCVTIEDTAKLAGYLWSLPNGVQSMSGDVSGLVQTSLNIGIVKYKKGKFTIDISLRSSIESEKLAAVEKVAAVTSLAGGTYELTGDYPGWQYRTDSPLREKMIAVYERMYGEKPKVEAVHAGLECGILASKIPGLDCVSLGPQMNDIHTTEETLSISSTKRVWEYLLEFLKTKEV